jgi:hypothetical protein
LRADVGHDPHLVRHFEGREPASAGFKNCALQIVGRGSELAGIWYNERDRYFVEQQAAVEQRQAGTPRTRRWPVSPGSTGAPSSRSTKMPYSGAGRPIGIGRFGRWTEPTVPCVIVSVIPYQPIVLTPKKD